MSSAKRRKQPPPPPPYEEEEVFSAPAPSSTEDKRAKARRRVDALISRAAHPDTPEEEARTSALVAVKMIHAEKLLEERVPRHPLIDRLEGLKENTLDELGGFVEQFLEDPETAQEGRHAMRWRMEAKHLQRKLDAFAGSLRWILQGYKICLADRPGFCVLCHRPLQLGDILVWKRRRFEAAHYMCCAVLLQNQGTFPRAMGI